MNTLPSEYHSQCTDIIRGRSIREYVHHPKLMIFNDEPYLTVRSRLWDNQTYPVTFPPEARFAPTDL